MSDLRMPDVNLIILSCRLTRDPELRYTASQVPFCKFGVAHTSKYKTKDCEQREETTFIDVVVWKQAAGYVSKYMRKGTPILVEGRLRCNEWEDKATGQKRSRHEIQATRVQRLDYDGNAAERGAESDAPEHDDIPF